MQFFKNEPRRLLQSPAPPPFCARSPAPPKALACNRQKQSKNGSHPKDGSRRRLSKKLFYRKRESKIKERNQRKEKYICKKISTRLSSRNPCACLLFPFSHSGVLLYADECKNEKYTYLFRRLPACRDFLDTLRREPSFGLLPS